MLNQPSVELLNIIPDLCDTDWTPAGKKLIYLHFFMGNSDWYVAEFDGKDIFFCFAIINGNKEMSEWGYFSFEEFRHLKAMDCELNWQVKQAEKIEKIRRNL